MVINSSIFQVIIAFRPITLVMGKISYEDKARIETLFLDTEQSLQNFRKTVISGIRKRVESFVQRKQSVNGLVSVGQQGNESKVAIG